MKYLALIYTGERDWDALPEDERSAIYARYRELTEDGRYLGGNELAPTTTATTVRVRDGETVVSDGPFVETKEALGGYFAIEAESMDDALDFAARIPGAETGAVEVRPCHVDESAEQEAESEEVPA
jgi:hypothetical protein